MRELLTKMGEGSRWSYFGRSLLRSLDPERRSCPNCGCAESSILKRKYLVTALAQCSDCRILYRVPTDDSDFNEEFYQSEYTSGFTTDCPSAEDLEQFVATGFQGTPKDFSKWIRLLHGMGLEPGQRVLDFGASWGYGTWQLQAAGYDAVGYELGRERARYGREKLGVPVYDRLEDMKGPFDAVFSCHVLEHVPRPSDVVDWAKGVLRPGGLFVAVTPNGSAASMHADARRFHRCWGRVHPFYLNDEFYQRSFGEMPKLMASPPYELTGIQQWDQRSDLTMDLCGWELLVAAVVNPDDH